MNKINDKSRVIFRYNDAIKRKFKNKSVTIVNHDDETFTLEILNLLSKEEANEPAIVHQVEKGVLRVSALRMSKETLEAVVLNGIEILNHINPTPTASSRS